MPKSSLSALVVGLFLAGGAGAIRAHDRPGPDGSPVRDHINARVELSRPDPAVDADAEGDLHLKEHKGRSAIHVHLKHLTPGATYDARIQKGEMSGDLGDITIPVREEEPKPPRCFQADLAGGQEVPPVVTEATGMGKFKLSGRGRDVLRYEVKVEGLSGPATAAHIHAGAVGVPGGVIIPLDHETLRGHVEVTPEQVEALESGNTYVNVHTAAHPDGEVRGQIAACPSEPPPPPKGNGRLKIDTRRGDALPLGAASVRDLVGATVSIVDAEGKVVLSGLIESLEQPKPPPPPPPAPRCFAATLSGGQEVPPVDTQATGTARFNLSRRDRSILKYEVKVDGLSGPAVAAHIHAGAVGVPGDVIIPLDHETLEGEVAVTPEQVAAIESGDTYVNVHTEAHPGGEIRGQIAQCAPKPPRGDDGEDEGEDEGADESGASAPVGSAYFFDEFDFEIEERHDASFRRGDANMDASFDIADPISALGVLFLGAPPPYCQDTLDGNDDGALDVSDPITMLQSLFSGEGPLPSPGVDGPAGFDSSPDDLLCEEDL